MWSLKEVPKAIAFDYTECQEYAEFARFFQNQIRPDINALNAIATHKEDNIKAQCPFSDSATLFGKDGKEGTMHALWFKTTGSCEQVVTKETKEGKKWKDLPKFPVKVKLSSSFQITSDSVTLSQCTRCLSHTTGGMPCQYGQGVLSADASCRSHWKDEQPSTYAWVVSMPLDNMDSLMPAMSEQRKKDRDALLAKATNFAQGRNSDEVFQCVAQGPWVNREVTLADGQKPSEFLRGEELELGGPCSCGQAVSCHEEQALRETCVAKAVPPCPVS